ncbi:MAG: hypothetical protein LBU66_08525 [Treponema sp.]|nr:hypothetical protein [Treponema sp.]
MALDYHGFIILRISHCSYFVIGPGLRGYLSSAIEAQHFIDGFIAGIHCEY